MSCALTRALWVLAVAAALALGLANLVMGELNQDEGWYLYAARMVSEGQLPYRDFAFTQAPLLPLAYSLAQPLVEWGGLAAGRAITLTLTLLTAFLAAAVARRLAAKEMAGWAAITAFSLAAVNVYQSYFGTVVKTYALCGFLLTLAAWLLTVARDRRSFALHALAGFLLAAAAGTRISAGAMLPVVGLYLLWQRERCGPSAWFGFGLGGAIGLAAIFLPFILIAPEAFRTFVLDYHSARDAGSLVSRLVFKVGCLSRVMQAYGVAVSVGILLVLFRVTLGQRSKIEPLNLALWIGLAAMTLVHLSAPFPYDDYQVPLYPLFAALLAAGLARVVMGSASGWAAALASGVLLLSGVAAFSSPINQGWMVLGRDRIWWRLREQPALLQLRDVARDIKARSGDATQLLTQDIYLAVETGLRVPRGLEMGPFSYYPGLTRDEAHKLNVVNREMLAEIVRRADAPVAAFSAYSFVMAAPAVEKLTETEQADWQALVEAVYRPVREVESFGQGATRLRIYERRADGDAR
jgi:hypothetical protein